MKKAATLLLAVMLTVIFITIAKADDKSKVTYRAIIEYKVTDFNVGAGDINDAQRALLDEIAAHMKEYPKDLVILSGMVSSVHFSRHNEFCQMLLAQRRSLAVTMYLVSSGVHPSRIVQSKVLGIDISNPPKSGGVLVLVIPPAPLVPPE